jgi:hypothetical protein
MSVVPKAAFLFSGNTLTGKQLKRTGKQLNRIGKQLMRTGK